MCLLIAGRQAGERQTEVKNWRPRDQADHKKQGDYQTACLDGRTKVREGKMNEKMSSQKQLG